MCAVGELRRRLLSSLIPGPDDSLEPGNESRERRVSVHLSWSPPLSPLSLPWRAPASVCLCVDSGAE